MVDPADEEATPRPRYKDEDTSPTSDREIQGFYYYGWAAEVFVVCAMGEQGTRNSNINLESTN